MIVIKYYFFLVIDVFSSNNNKPLLLLILFLLFNQACLTYSTMPKVNNSTITLLSDKSMFYSIAIGSSKKENESMIKVLNTFNIKELYEVDKMVIHGLFLLVTITHANAVRKGAGVEWLTGLTLGIIPTYSIDIDYYIYNYELLYNGNLINKKEYKLVVNSFNWLFSIPFKWGPRGDYYRMENEIKKMTQDFFSGIDFKNMK